MQNLNNEQQLVCQVEHNLKDYVIDMYSRFFDLTEGRYMALTTLLDYFAARFITVEGFRRVFSMEEAGYFTILEFITQIENKEKLRAYGEICYQEAFMQQVTSEKEEIKKQKI